MMKQLLFTLSGCFLLTGCAGQGINENMMIVAHRGGASLGPENTLTCIRAGIASGADMIEIDVHLTADGQAVVCHDETIDRTTDGKGRIENLTLAQVREAHIRDAAPEERIPTLAEVLQEVKGKCGLLLEVKKTRDDEYPGIEEKILEELDRADMRRNRVVIQSFNGSVLERFHALDPGLPLEKLLVCRVFGKWAIDIRLSPFSLDSYKYVQSINCYAPLLSRRFIEKIHAAGIQVKAWTVDSPDKVPAGVDGVITDCPDQFVEARKRAKD